MVDLCADSTIYNISYIMLPPSRPTSYLLPISYLLPLPATKQQNNKARPTPPANPEKDRARKAM